jgi:hypothetical protein
VRPCRCRPAGQFHDRSRTRIEATVSADYICPRQVPGRVRTLLRHSGRHSTTTARTGASLSPASDRSHDACAIEFLCRDEP